jgi:hypothetical protein
MSRPNESYRGNKDSRVKGRGKFKRNLATSLLKEAARLRDVDFLRNMNFFTVGWRMAGYPSHV